ncbi:MAG: hypothetical protein J0G33_08180 [Afipia felis]|nr:hypothetical protein [Afipia felis]
MDNTAEKNPAKPTFREDLGWPTEDELLAPKYGFDNACDIREAVKLCRSKRYALSADEMGRHQAFRLGQELYALGLRQKTAHRLIRTHSKPKLSRSEITEAINNVWRAPANPPGAWSMAGRPDFDFDEDHAADPEDLSWMEGGGMGSWPYPLHYDVKQNNAALLREFCHSRPGMLVSAADGNLYSLRENGIWEEKTAQELAVEFRATDPTAEVDTPRVERIVRCAAVENYTPALPFEWITEPDNAPEPNDLALFENGMLDTATGTLLPHDGSLLATGTPAFKYEPGAKCPRWLQFLNETLDPSYHATVQEMLGYLLTPDTSAHAIFVLSGVTRSGKSTLMHVAESLVGPQHANSRTLNDLAGDFGLEGCGDSKLLSIPDASDAHITRRSTALERLKTISGGDVVSINRKGKGIVTQRIPARILMACNRMPKMLDESGALAARVVQFTFGHTVPESERDRDLGAKLEAEMPGIATWALKGLRRLRANGGKFTIGKKGAAAVRDLARAQSPALRFTDERLILTKNRDDFLPLEKLYEEYSMWADDEGLSFRERRNKTDLKDDLAAALGDQIAYVRRRWHDPFAAPQNIGTKRRGFTGLAIKPTYTDMDRE